MGGKVQGIYADEFNLNDSEESIEQFQEIDDSLGGGPMG